MLLSTTCKAAIKAVVFLASQKDQGVKTALTAIAGHIGASEHTVGKMLQTLVKDRIIRSSKGPGGGFYITAEQTCFPVVKIIASIDGMEIFKECALGLSQCSSAHPCPIHNEYKKARDIYEQIFRNKRVVDLCKPVNKKKAWLV
jgi:Rrf2 family protein